MSNYCKTKMSTNNSAFTLLEIMISLTLFVLVLGSVFTVFSFSISRNKKLIEEQSQIASVRQILDKMSRELKGAKINTSVIRNGSICPNINEVFDIDNTNGSISFLLGDKCVRYKIGTVGLNNGILMRDEERASDGVNLITDAAVSDPNLEIILLNFTVDKIEGSSVTVDIKVKKISENDSRAFSLQSTAKNIRDLTLKKDYIKSISEYNDLYDTDRNGDYIYATTDRGIKIFNAADPFDIQTVSFSEISQNFLQDTQSDFEDANNVTYRIDTVSSPGSIGLKKEPWYSSITQIDDSATVPTSVTDGGFEAGLYSLNTILHDPDPAPGNIDAGVTLTTYLTPPSFGPVRTVSFSYPFFAYAADIDGDEYNDLIGASYYGDGGYEVVWFRNNQDKTFSSRIGVDSNFSYGLFVYADDLDSDGDQDIIATSRGYDDIAWWDNIDGLGSFSKKYVDSSFRDPYSVYVADFDNDNDKDVAGASYYSSNNVKWWKNNGNGTFNTTENTIDSTFAYPYSVHGADFDNDDYNDVVAASWSLNDVAWWKNNGNGTFNTTENIIDSNFSTPRSVYAADLDGDGNQDVLAASYNLDTISWWKGNGNGTFGSRIDIGTGFNGPYYAYATDLDGDGDQDVLAAAYLGSEVAWWENIGGGSFSAKKNIGTAAGARSVYAVDLDNDGDKDVLAPSYNSNNISWWENDQQSLYNSSGTYTSYLDSEKAVSNWDTFLVNKLSTAGGTGSTQINIKILSSSDNLGAPAGIDSVTGNCNITITTDGQTAPYDISACAGSGQYLWYKATLTASPDQSKAPILDKVTATSHGSDYYTSGELLSIIYDTGDNYGFGDINWNETPDGGTITVQVKSCETYNCSDNLSWSGCEVISNNDLSESNCVVDGDRYLQYKIVLNSDGNQNPLLHDINIQYFPSFDKLKINNNYLYALNTGRLSIFDININPENPVIVGYLDGKAGSLKDFDINSDYVYFADFGYDVVLSNTIETWLQDTENDFSLSEGGTDSLQGLWHMDNNWNDSSGNLNNGTPFGDSHFTVNSADGSYSGYFDGAGDYVNASFSGTLNLSGTQGSFSAWIYPEFAYNDGVSRFIFDWPIDGNEWIRMFKTFDSHKLRYLHYGGEPSNWIGYDHDISANWDYNWHHVAMTWDTNTTELKAYFDGQHVRTLTNIKLPTAPAANLVIGNSFIGNIDEVKVYGRVLEEAEISNIYDNRYTTFTQNPGFEELRLILPAGSGTQTTDGTDEQGFNKPGSAFDPLEVGVIKPAAGLPEDTSVELIKPPIDWFDGAFTGDCAWLNAELLNPGRVPEDIDGSGVLVKRFWFTSFDLAGVCDLTGDYPVQINVRDVASIGVGGQLNAKGGNGESSSSSTCTNGAPGIGVAGGKNGGRGGNWSLGPIGDDGEDYFSITAIIGGGAGGHEARGSGGGGAYGGDGGKGYNAYNISLGYPGGTLYGSNDISTLFGGSGGGGGGTVSGSCIPTNTWGAGGGGAGGGAINIRSADSISISGGSINVSGGSGGDGDYALASAFESGGGGGAGGSIKLEAPEVNMTGFLRANGSNGGFGAQWGAGGGGGGRVYITKVSGTINTANVYVDRGICGSLHGVCEGDGYNGVVGTYDDTGILVPLAPYPISSYYTSYIDSGSGFGANWKNFIWTKSQEDGLTDTAIAFSIVTSNTKATPPAATDFDSGCLISDVTENGIHTFDLAANCDPAAVDYNDRFLWYRAELKSDLYRVKTPRLEDVKVEWLDYHKPGTYTSAVYDTKGNDGFYYVTFEGLENQGSIVLKAKSCVNSDCSDKATWAGCEVNTYTDLSDGACVTDNEQYVQYQLTMDNNGDLELTPSFNKIAVRYFPLLGTQDSCIKVANIVNKNNPYFESSTGASFCNDECINDSATVKVDSANSNLYFSFANSKPEARVYSADITDPVSPIVNAGFASYSNFSAPKQIELTPDSLLTLWGVSTTTLNVIQTDDTSNVASPTQKGGWGDGISYGIYTSTEQNALSGDNAGVVLSNPISASGTYTAYLDGGLGTTYLWDEFFWEGIFPKGLDLTDTKISFKIKSSDSNIAAPDFSSGVCDIMGKTRNGNFNFGLCPYFMEDCVSTQHQYLWYEATLEASNDLGTTPSLGEVSSSVIVDYPIPNDFCSDYLTDTTIDAAGAMTADPFPKQVDKSGLFDLTSNSFIYLPQDDKIYKYDASTGVDKYYYGFFGEGESIEQVDFGGESYLMAFGKDKVETIKEVSVAPFIKTGQVYGSSTEGSICKVEGDSSYIYAVYSNSAVDVFDKNDLTWSRSLGGSINISEVIDAVLYGDYIIIFGFDSSRTDGYYRVVDISPVRSGGSPMDVVGGSGVTDIISYLALKDNYLFASWGQSGLGNGGLKVFSIAPDGTLSEDYSVIDPNNYYTYHLVGSGDTLFQEVWSLSDTNRRLREFNISNPISPLLIDTYQDINPGSMVVKNNLLYTSGNDLNIYAIDNITAGNEINTTSPSVSGYNYDLQIAGSNVLLSRGLGTDANLGSACRNFESLAVIDISSPESPFIKNYYSGGMGVLIGDYIYREGGNNKIELLKIFDSGTAVEK